MTSLPKMEHDEREAKRRERKGTMYQILMGLVANLTILGPSMGFGYSAVALESLKKSNGDLTLSENQANWFATAAALGVPFGCLLSSVVMRRGRKLSLLVTSGTSMIGWLVIYLSSNYEQLIAGRVIGGISSGLASVPATVYIAEVTGPRWRSTMVTWTSIAIALGILLVYTFGYFLKNDWRNLALICSIFPMVAIVLVTMLMPESPMWLRDRGRVDEACKILKKFRGFSKDDVATNELSQELRPRRQQQNKNIMKHIFRRNALIPFGIMLSYFFFQQFSGIFVIVYYAVDITLEAGIKIDAYLGAILIGLTRLFGSLLVAFVSRKFGRRIPTIASGAGMTLFMGILSIYLFMKDRGYEFHDHAIIPVACVMMYIFMSTMGFLVLPFAMVGEIYPSKVKDILSGLTTCLGYVFSSITVKTYPDMLDHIGKHGVFFFYAAMSLVGTVFLGIFLPETRGLTLDQIEDIFSKKKLPKDEENASENERMVGPASNGVSTT